MEQLVARRAHNPKVVGSSPAPATRNIRQSGSYSKITAFFNLLCFKNVLTKHILRLIQKNNGIIPLINTLIVSAIINCNSQNISIFKIQLSSCESEDLELRYLLLSFG